jgi:hypothetical protein
MDLLKKLFSAVGFTDKITGAVIDTLYSTGTRLWNVKEDAEKLRRTENRIRAVLTDAEQRRFVDHDFVELWLQELRATEFDVDAEVENFAWTTSAPWPLCLGCPPRSHRRSGSGSGSTLASSCASAGGWMPGSPGSTNASTRSTRAGEGRGCRPGTQGGHRLRRCSVHGLKLLVITTRDSLVAPRRRSSMLSLTIVLTFPWCPFGQRYALVSHNRYMPLLIIGGVCQVLTPAVWKLKVPSRIHIFLWLLANNKTLTRDNLAKRKNLKDLTCVFCNELETVHHLFFDCCVANVLCSEISEALGMVVNPDFESVAKMWLLGKNFQHINVCTAAVLWSIWKLRNEFIFQGRSWSGIGELLRRCARMVQDWSMLSKCEDGAHLEELANVLGMRSRLPPRLAGSHQLQSMRSLVSETVTPLRENAMSVSPETEPGDTLSQNSVLNVVALQ